MSAPAPAQPATPRDCHGFWKTRYTLLLLNLLGLAVSYATRVNLSMAIVDMVNNTALLQRYSQAGVDVVAVDDSCPSEPLPADSPARKDGEFAWDKRLQGEILAAFYYGYTVGHVPGGVLADRLGGKVVFGCGILISSVLSVLTPLSAWAGEYVLFANRVGQGLVQGGIIPAIQTIISRWAPDHERSKFSVIYLGVFGGTLVSMAVSGALCETAVGWPLAFYFFGALGLLWCVPWWLLAQDSPAQHRRIDPAERLYIEATIASSAKKKLPVPWKRILLSPPLWAFVSLMITLDWTYYLLITSLPLYIANILHFDVRSNGFLSAVPQITGVIGSLLFGWGGDIVFRKGYISKINGLRVVNGLSTLVPAATLLVVTVVGCSSGVLVGMLALSGFCLATYCAAPYMNMQAVAPNYSGTIAGIVNSIANLTGIAVPYVVGAFTDANQSRSAWNSVFYLSAGLAVVGYTIYAVFTTDQVQPWNEPAPGIVNKTRREKGVDNVAFESDGIQPDGQRTLDP